MKQFRFLAVFSLLIPLAPCFARAECPEDKAEHRRILTGLCQQALEMGRNDSAKTLGQEAFNARADQMIDLPGGCYQKCVSRKILDECVPKKQRICAPAPEDCQAKKGNPELITLTNVKENKDRTRFHVCLRGSKSKAREIASAIDRCFYRISNKMLVELRNR